MDQLALDDFADTIGEPYLVEAGGAEHALVLEKAVPLSGSVRAGGGFRLEFRGPAEPILPQSIYGLRHGNRAHEIFVVPVGRDASGTLYEAVFY